MITPAGLSAIFMPATKSLRSGTWASTLLPSSRSAARSGPSAVAVSRPKNSTSVAMPRSSATSATFAAGSMPSTGTPRCLKNWSRYPSFDAISTTWLELSNPKRSIIAST